MLAWDPSLAIDVPEIDAQHRSLFSQAARFDAAVRAGESSAEVEQILAFLSRYAVEHFEAEGDSISLLLALSGFLMRWLREHVATSDRAIGEFLGTRAAPPG